MSSSSTTHALVRSGILWQDQQHVELIRCVRRLQSMILERQLGHSELQSTKEFLRWYVRMHFGAEDAYMDHYQYPQAEQHRTQHAAMSDQLEHLFQVLDDGMGNPDLHACAELCVKLNQWYLSHIAGPDQELATFLRAHGVN